MIKAKVQRNQEDQEEEKESEENLSIYKDLYYLKDPVYYRQQVLQILMKISEATERQAQAMEELATPSKEDK